MTDLQYTIQGLFTVFVPVSKAGEAAWNDIAKQSEGTGKVLTFHLDSTIKQLKSAGYNVRKAPKPKALSADDLDAMLKELEM